MLDRETGRPRGFGFVTFTSYGAMKDAIDEMHGQELDGRVISVNKAEPKIGGADGGYGGYPGGRGNSYGNIDRSAGRSDCFKCGRPGHWARDCPSGGYESQYPSRPRFSSGGGRGDRFGDRYEGRVDDRYYGGGGRYGSRDRMDGKDSRYDGPAGRDRYGPGRYQAAGDHFENDRYEGSDRYSQGGYRKDRGYNREGGPRGGIGDRYRGNGGPARYEGGGYRDRSGPYDRPPKGGSGPYDRSKGGPGPYDRPPKVGRSSSYDDHF